MVEIEITDDFLEDIDYLIKDFNTFMTKDLVGAQKGLETKLRTQVLSLVNYSNKNSKIFDSFFKYPLMEHKKENIDKLDLNVSKLVTFCYDYILFAESVLKTTNPQIYKGRFSDIKKNYSLFYNKHLRV